jgi:hypothetical protein
MEGPCGLPSKNKICPGHLSRIHTKSKNISPIRKTKVGTFLVLTEEYTGQYLNGTSALALAKLNNCSTGTVIAALKRQGICTRTKRESNLIQLELLHAAADAMRITGELGKRISAGLRKIDYEDFDELVSTRQQQQRVSAEYKNWRLSIFARDNYCCIECGATSQAITGKLEAHHIYPRRDFIDRIFDLLNGVTLCGLCHRKTIRKEHLYYARYDYYVTKRNTDPTYTLANDPDAPKVLTQGSASLCQQG